MNHRLGFLGEKENFLKHFHFLSIEVFTHILLHYFFIFSFLCNQKLSIILFFFCESSDLYPPRCCDFHHPLDIIYSIVHSASKYEKNMPLSPFTLKDLNSRCSEKFFRLDVLWSSQALIKIFSVLEHSELHYCAKIRLYIIQCNTQ